MLEIGSVVDGKYKILSKVGQGGMSVVYMAINEKANKTWAVKEVRKDGVLEFDAVNDNLPEIIEQYGNNSRKITCNYYIDDKAVLPEMVS